MSFFPIRPLPSLMAVTRPITKKQCQKRFFSQWINHMSILLKPFFPLGMRKALKERHFTSSRHDWSAFTVKIISDASSTNKNYSWKAIKWCYWKDFGPPQLYGMHADWLRKHWRLNTVFLEAESADSLVHIKSIHCKTDWK